MFPVEVILDVMYQFFMASNKRFHCRVYQGVYRHMNIMFFFILVHFLLKWLAVSEKKKEIV